MKIIVFLIFVSVILLILFLYSACVISGRCSREEEEYEQTRNV